MSVSPGLGRGVTGGTAASARARGRSQGPDAPAASAATQVSSSRRSSRFRRMRGPSRAGQPPEEETRSSSRLSSRPVAPTFAHGAWGPGKVGLISPPSGWVGRPSSGLRPASPGGRRRAGEDAPAKSPHRSGPTPAFHLPAVEEAPVVGATAYRPGREEPSVIGATAYRPGREEPSVIGPAAHPP